MNAIQEMILPPPSDEEVQPKSYTEAELSKLREFVDILKKDESRSALACWGDYDEHSVSW